MKKPSFKPLKQVAQRVIGGLKAREAANKGKFQRVGNQLYRK